MVITPKPAIESGYRFLTIMITSIWIESTLYF